MIVLICTCKQIYFYLDLECHSLTNFCLSTCVCHALNIVTCSCLQSESGEWSVPGAGGERGAGGECVPKSA